MQDLEILLGRCLLSAPSLSSEILLGGKLDSRCVGNLYSPAQAVEGSEVDREEVDKEIILELTG